MSRIKHAVFTTTEHTYPSDRHLKTVAALSIINHMVGKQIGYCGNISIAEIPQPKQHRFIIQNVSKFLLRMRIAYQCVSSKNIQYNKTLILCAV